MDAVGTLHLGDSFHAVKAANMLGVLENDTRRDTQNRRAKTYTSPQVDGQGLCLLAVRRGTLVVGGLVVGRLEG